jgi:ABC-type polysaccharide/polyol phosphate transport system ATPase subunit
MKLFVKGYNGAGKSHICKVINPVGDDPKEEITVDLMVDGGIEWKEGIELELIGQTVECEWIHPYEYIANRVKLVKKETA